MKNYDKGRNEDYYVVELTAEECVGIVNLLEKAREDCGIISAMKKIDELSNKFRSPDRYAR